MVCVYAAGVLDERMEPQAESIPKAVVSKRAYMNTRVFVFTFKNVNNSILFYLHFLFYLFIIFMTEALRNEETVLYAHVSTLFTGHNQRFIRTHVTRSPPIGLAKLSEVFINRGLNAVVR